MITFRLTYLTYAPSASGTTTDTSEASATSTTSAKATSELVFLKTKQATWKQRSE